MTTTTYDYRSAQLGARALFVAASRWAHARAAGASAHYVPKERSDASGAMGYAPVARTSGCQYADLIRQTWGADDEWAISIAMRESRCTAGARSRDGARGVFQLLGHVGDGCAYDAACNISAAWHLYEQCGRGPWSPPYFCRRP